MHASLTDLSKSAHAVRSCWSCCCSDGRLAVEVQSSEGFYLMRETYHVAKSLGIRSGLKELIAREDFMEF
jgi:hypothetical protein